MKHKLEVSNLNGYLKWSLILSQNNKATCLKNIQNFRARNNYDTSPSDNPLKPIKTTGTDRFFINVSSALLLLKVFYINVYSSATADTSRGKKCIYSCCDSPFRLRQLLHVLPMRRCEYITCSDIIELNIKPRCYVGGIVNV